MMVDEEENPQERRSQQIDESQPPFPPEDVGDLKGDENIEMSECPNCGMQMAADVSACPGCGVGFAPEGQYPPPPEISPQQMPLSHETGEEPIPPNSYIEEEQIPPSPHIAEETDPDSPYSEQEQMPPPETGSTQQVPMGEQIQKPNESGLKPHTPGPQVAGAFDEYGKRRKNRYLFGALSLGIGIILFVLLWLLAVNHVLVEETENLIAIDIILILVGAGIFFILGLYLILTYPKSSIAELMASLPK